MEVIKLYELVGDFAENKDTAKKIRLECILPALEKKRAVTIDFEHVNGATQSFIHALISDALRKYPDIVYDNVFYKNANDDIRKVVTIVYKYMQESMD